MHGKTALSGSGRNLVLDVKNVNTTKTKFLHKRPKILSYILISPSNKGMCLTLTALPDLTIWPWHMWLQLFLIGHQVELIS